MDRHVGWSSLQWPGFEHVRMTSGEKEIIADGLLIAMLPDAPARVWYRIVCDVAWQIRRLEVDVVGMRSRLTITARGNGEWQDEAGQALPAIAGCQDADLSLTPFTNTLPIRRLALQPGDSRDLRTAYLALPDLKPQAVEQRYTCLEDGPGGGLYRYASGSFCADLPIDRDGLVIDNPGLWRQVAAR